MNYSKKFWVSVNIIGLLPAATKLGQGNVFTGVCDSVHGGVGVARRHPPGREVPLAKKHPPGKEIPPWQGGTPLARRPPCQGDPWQGDPPGRETPLARRTPGKETPPGRETPPAGRHPPLGSRLRDTVNERPVRILLECILV